MCPHSHTTYRQVHIHAANTEVSCIRTSQEMNMNLIFCPIKQMFKAFKKEHSLVLAEDWNSAAGQAVGLYRPTDPNHNNCMTRSRLHSWSPMLCSVAYKESIDHLCLPFTSTHPAPRDLSGQGTSLHAPGYWKSAYACSR